MAKNLMNTLIDLFHKLVYGCYEDEPIENTFKNLSKFVKKYGGYELVELVLPSTELLEKIEEISRKAEKHPEGSNLRQFLDLVIELLESPYFTDSLEFSLDAVKQRIKRSEMKGKLGLWAHASGKHSKKLNPRLRKKYSNMLQLWDINRMRRSNAAYMVMSLLEFTKSDGIVFSDETTNMQKELVSGVFSPAPDGKNGYVYDYIADEEKMKVKDTVDQFLISFANDVLK